MSRSILTPDVYVKLFTGHYSRWPKEHGEKVAAHLRYLDEWTDAIPKELPTEVTQAFPEFRQALALATNRAREYIAQVNALQAPPKGAEPGRQIEQWKSLTERHQSPASVLARELDKDIIRLRGYDFMRLVYSLRNDLSDASEFMDLMASLREQIEHLDGRVVVVRQEFEKQGKDSRDRLLEATTKACETIAGKAEAANAAVASALASITAKVAQAAQKAGEWEAKTKAKYEEAAQHFQNQAMGAFGAAFDKESVAADSRSRRAGWLALAGLIGLASVLLAFVIAEASGKISYADAGQIWRWASLRVIVVGFCAWVVGHYYRERRNFLHVGIANRHRRNLCTSYISVAEKMSEPAKEKYLATILPEISQLGKTGFITKEETPDMPTAKILGAVTEVLRSK